MSPNEKIIRQLPIDVYVRVSQVGGRDGDSFQSPEIQAEQAGFTLLGKGLTPGDTITDLDRSGGNTDREGFQTVMERIRTGQSGGVIVSKLDRFARNTRDLLEAVEEIEAHGAVFICQSPPLDTSDPAFGKFLLTLFGALAELELARLTDGLKVSATKAVQDKGIHGGGRVPAGYDRDDSRRLVPNTDAPAIVRAFEARADGSTYVQCAAILNDAGVLSGWARLTPKGETTPRGFIPWTEAATAALLQSDVYLGIARGGFQNVKEDAHPAIVSAGLFARVQARRNETGSYADPDRRRELLAGLVRCACCGKSMTPQEQSKRKPDGTRYDPSWRCTSRCAAAAGASVPALDSLVFGLLEERGKHVLPKVTSSDESRRAAEVRLENAQAALDGFAAEAGKAGLSPTVVATTLVGYQAEVDAAAEALNGIGDGTARSDWEDAILEFSLSLENPQPVLDAVSDGIEKARTTGVIEGAALVALLVAVNGYDNAKARRMIAGLVKSVVVTKATNPKQPLAERVAVTLV